MSKTAKVVIHARVLFTSGSEESKNAAKLMETNQLHFSETRVDPDSKEFPPNKLPLLITGEGPGWQGLKAIQSYVERAIAMGEG